MTKKVIRLGLSPVWLMTACSMVVLAEEPIQDTSKKKTAAEMDWVEVDQMTEEQRSLIPSYCAGGYVVPEYLPEEATSSLVDGEVLGVAQKATHDGGQKAVFEGDVELTQAPYQLKGASATLDQETNEITVTGGAEFRGPDFVMTGSELRYDMTTKAIEVDNASYLSHEAGFRGDSKEFDRVSQETVVIKQGTFTRCGPNDKSWSIAAGEIELDRAEGVGYATHVRLRVQDIPVFYLPYATFPIDDRRKSGFLYPSFGTSNIGRGAFLSTPYYFNLAPDYDATLTPQYIHGRGLYTELEGRHLSRYGPSSLGLGYIDDDENYSDENPRRDGYRWGAHFENSSSWAPGWTSEVNYSVVSDDDYVDDLVRTVSIESETHLDQYGQINYTDETWDFVALLQGYQTIDSDILEKNKPYNRLPEVDLIGEWDNDTFDWTLGSQYIYFYRDNNNLSGEDKVNGSRLRVRPEVALPMEALWGYVTPSIKIDQTDYVLKDRTDASGDHISRTVPFAEVDAGLYFDRPFQLGLQDFNQTLEPRLFYVYSPEKDQDNIPDFDSSIKSFSYSQLFSDDRFTGGDRIGDNNRLTVGLTSRFTELSSGIDRVVLSVGKIYYYSDRTVSLDGEGVANRSESPYAGEFSLTPMPGMDINVTGLWDDKEGKTIEGNSELSFHTQDYGYVLNLGHRYKREDDPLEQTDISTIFPVGERVSLFGRWLYDLNEENTAGALAGVEYRSCCWRAQLMANNYLTDDEELTHTIMFRIELKGLAGFGESAAAMDDEIPGYLNREAAYY